MIGVVYRPVATDPEGAGVSYGATIGGPDAARFVMNQVTREIRFAIQPDFEKPSDVGNNNVYDITLIASDGINTVTQAVAVTVTNVAPGFRVRRVATGLVQPVYATGLPDGSGRIVVIERAGRIRIVTPATATISSTDFLDIASQINSTDGEKGLLTIAFSPNFIVDHAFYLHMNPTKSNTSEIRQYHTLATDLAKADVSTANANLSVAQPATTNHKGGFLAFDTAGRLLIGFGDGGGTGDPLGNSQNRNTLLGKILRIDPTQDAFPNDDTRDYAIPPGNPFASGGGSPEILAMGVRNPFRGSVDPVTGDVFIGDVGQDAIEEVDRIPVNAAGLLNYGWNRREGSQPYLGGSDDPGFLLPVTEYLHGLDVRQGNSVTGGVVYRGPIEELQGQYVFSDVISSITWSVPVANLVNGSVLPSSTYVVRNAEFTPDVGSLITIVGLGTDNAGNVYFTNIAGDVFKLEPSS